MKIIGISGKAGSGKDWLASILIQHYGYKKWSFALPMKAAGHGMGFTIEEVDVTKPPHVREWLQRYGTEEHRVRYRDDFWLRTADYYLQFLESSGMADRVVFPDVRFPNEAKWVRERGGKAIRLWHGDRPYPLAGTDFASHVSETALDFEPDLFDLHMTNMVGFTEEQARYWMETSDIVPETARQIECGASATGC